MGRRAASYARLTVAEKQVVHRDRMREPAVRCPSCDAQTTVADLLTHVDERCPGRTEPHPQSRWVSWREALELAPKRTVLRWIQRGSVRSRGEPMERQYLLRDLTTRLAARRARRR